jgi:4-amino-4-deoxy-L-arabinose transferase-like glycosyltransferase
MSTTPDTATAAWVDGDGDGDGRGEMAGPPGSKRRSPLCPPPRISWRRYLPPLLVGLIVRFFIAVIAAQPRIPAQADQYYYRAQGELITHGYWWVLPGSVAHGAPGAPAAIHPPLFSGVLALADLLGFHGMVAQRGVLSVLSVTAIFCCGRVGARLPGKGTEVTVAWVAALLTGMWIYEGQDLSEAITVPLLAFTILMLYRLLERPTVPRAVMLGIAVALGALTRPELVVLVIVFAPIWFASFRWSVRAKLTLVFLAVIVVIVGPWVGRNLHDSRDPEFISENLGSVLVGSNCPSTYYGPGLGTWAARCGSTVVPPPGGQSTLDHLDQRIGVHYARAHLGRVPVVVAARFGRSLGVWPAPSAQVNWNATAGGVWPHWNSWLYLVTWWFSIPFVIIGAVSVRRDRMVVWPLVSLIILFFAVSMVLYADTRFASSCQPALAILVGVGLTRSWSAIGSTRGAHARVGADVLGV